MKDIPICELKKPANCEYRIDGGLSHIILCSGNKLCKDIGECPNRKVSQIYPQIGDKP